MPRPDPRAPKEGQNELFPADSLPVTRPGYLTSGRHTQAVDGALSAARERGLTDDVDEALLTTIRAGAWALDSFEAQNKPYGPSKLIQPMIEAIREARLTPDARQTTVDDSIKDLLNELASPAVSTTPEFDAAPGGGTDRRT